MNIELETDWLILKSLDDSYSKTVLQYYIKNTDFFRPWVPEYISDYFTEQYHLKKLSWYKKEIDAGNMIKLWMFRKDNSEKIIGDIALSNITPGPFLSSYLEYRLDENENGNGYMREAVIRIADYAFNELNLHRIEANIMPVNSRSRNLVEKLGFVNEGISKKYLKINGKWEDHIHYVLLNEKLE
jgi:[ribosomal protein S5]-alanine N-acetyltransferase